MQTYQQVAKGDQWTVRLEGKLDREARSQFSPILEQAKNSGAKEVAFDLEKVSSFDSLGVASLIEALGWAKRLEIGVKLRNPDSRLLDYLSLVEADRLIEGERHAPPEGFLHHMGRIASPFINALKTQVVLFGETLYWVVVGPFRKRGIRWDRVSQEIVLVGVNAIPIVALISVLMGMILALQAAVQLRQFGATIFIADLVGISITREIGPLLTAIIIAGRSGSANAAEIGTMVVSEELDAIRQMGINPTRFLLVPKIVGLAIAMPCLGVIANAIGVFSGAFITTTTLDMGMGAYLEETRLAIHASDLYSGLFKCAVFGLIIGATGCGQGLAVKGGAGEVGRATTVAVVVSIFFIITADTFFTLIFHQ